MNDTQNTNWTTYHAIKNVHMNEIERQQKQIQRLEWVISACVGASLALTFVIIHQIFFV